LTGRYDFLLVLYSDIWSRWNRCRIKVNRSIIVNRNERAWLGSRDSFFCPRNSATARPRPRLSAVNGRRVSLCYKLTGTNNPTPDDDVQVLSTSTDDACRSFITLAAQLCVHRDRRLRVRQRRADHRRHRWADRTDKNTEREEI